MGRQIVFAWAVAGLLAAAIAPPLFAQEPDASAPPGATARITYITGSSVYLDAGRQDGLREGDPVEVIRDGTPIALLKVSFLSEHRASCTIVSSSAPPAVGDLVRYSSRAPASSRSSGSTGAGDATAGGSAQPGARSSPGWTGGLHGRAGVRYLTVRDSDGVDNGFSQPALDLKVDGYGVGGSDFDLNVDVRARQTYRSAPGADDVRLNQVYRLATTYHLPGTRQRLTVGRQFAPNLEAVSIFDGLLYDMNGDRWGGGLFTGTQPDPSDFGIDSTVRDYGGYYLVHSLPETSRQWAITLGLIDSYADGSVNREWLYLQTRYRGPRLSGFLTQEVDYNRSWKTSVAGESTFAPTSTFASFHVRASDRVTFYVGYDNRRSVRIWLDRVTPATQFDDTFRRGSWAGATFRPGRHVFFGGDARSSAGGPSGQANGWSGNFGFDGIGRVNFDFSARSTRYTNVHSDGWLHTVTAGLDLGRPAHLELAIGRVEESDASDPILDRTDEWYGLDIDLALGRSWFLILSEERYTGTSQDNDQTYAAVTYRF